MNKEEFFLGGGFQAEPFMPSGILNNLMNVYNES